MRETGERYPGNFPGMNPIIGTPDDIVDEMTKMHGIGLNGCALVFLNYLNELPYFVQEAMPRLERAGLREKFVMPAGRGD
jgi:alkanesulfonate monooxygenase SsuD/methylene tetrahydromethanopterin reductase-like flavin-dependent oxidoreductase (luciferase family)